ncbi:MAG: hypothetical protein JXR30_02635, partial [Alphaproteobacteria bacterium]|nr:hypothetical protein [Alphaproteobacteria bacterium]
MADQNTIQFIEKFSLTGLRPKTFEYLRGLVATNTSHPKKKDEGYDQWYYRVNSELTPQERAKYTELLIKEPLVVNFLGADYNEYIQSSPTLDLQELRRKVSGFERRYYLIQHFYTIYEMDDL